MDQHTRAYSEQEAKVLLQRCAKIHDPNSTPQDRRYADNWMRLWLASHSVALTSICALEILEATPADDPMRTNPAIAATVCTALRNRAKSDMQISKHLAIMLRISPMLEGNSAALRCLGSAICMACLYKGNVPVEDFVRELETKGSVSALFVVGSLPQDVKECRRANAKADALKKLVNRAVHVLSCMDTILQKDMSNKELILEFATHWLHLLPASAIVHAPFSSLVAACATAGERGADFMEAIVAKTVTLKMDDPAVMPFVQNLLDHVSRTADTKTHDNFLKVRLLLSAVEAWRTQPQMVERILGQVLASLKSVKTACLTAPVLPKLKRACGGKLPLAAELIQKLRVFSRIPTEEEFESLNDDDLQELQDYRNELRCCLRDLICTSEETAFFVNQCALNIRSASSWQAMEEEFHVLSAIAKNVVGLSVPQISEIIFNIAKDGLKMRSVIWANRLLASTFLLFCSVYSSVLLEEDGEDDEREVVLDGAAAVPANKLRRGNNANAGIPPNEQGGGSSSSTTVRPSSTFDEEVLTNLVELSLNSLVVHPVRLQNRLEHAANNLDALTAQPNLLVSEFAQTYRASPEYENYRQMNLKLCRWDFRSKQDHTGAVVLQKLCSSANSHLLGQNDRCVEVMAPILFDFVKAALVDSPELCTVEYSSLLLLSEALGALASHSGNVGRWVLDRYFNLGVDYLRAAIQKAGVESSPPEQGSSSTGMGGGAAGSSSAAGPEGSQSALSSRTKSTTESSSPTGENGSFLKKRCRIPAADGGANVTEAIFSHVNLVFRQACLLGDKKHQLRPPKNPATDSVVTTPKSTTTSRSGSVSSNKSITDELDSGHRVRAANFEPYSQQRLEIARQNATNSTNSLTVFVEACTHAVFLASFPKGLEAVDDFLFSVGSSPALCPFVLKLVPQLINHVDYYRVAVDLISLLIQNCQVNAALIFGAGAPGSANSEADRAALSAQVRELTQGVLSRVGQFLLPDLKPKIATLFLHPRDAWGLHSGGFLLARQRTRSSGMLDREQSGVPRPRLEHLDGPRVADLVVAFLECSRNGRSLLNEDSWLLAFVATIFSLVSGGRAENCGGRLSMKLGVDFIACALSDHAVGNLQGGLSISQANPPVAPINPVAVMIENSTLDQLMLPYLTEVLNAGLEFDDGRAGRMLRRRHRHMMHRHERSLAMQEHADLLHLYEDEAHVPIDGFGGGGMLGAMRPGGGGAASANPGGGAGGGAPPVPERLVPPQNTKIASLIVRALLKSIVERGLEQCTEVASLLLLFRNVLVNFRDILIQALDFDGMGRTPKNVREGFCKELLDLAPDAKLNTVKNIIKKLCKNSAPLHTSPGTVGEEGLAADMIRSPDRRPADPEIKKRSRNF